MMNGTLGMGRNGTSNRSFTQVLGDSAPKKPAPLKVRRGFGTTDTLAKQTRLASAVDQAHLTVMKRLSNKTRATNISNFSSQYMIEDTKSHAGDAFKQVDYVVVKREAGYTPDYGLIAKRA